MIICYNRIINVVKNEDGRIERMLENIRVHFFVLQLPQLKGMENPEDFEIDDEGPDIPEEEVKKSRCY